MQYFPIFSSILYLVTGLLLYIILFNRVLINLTEGRRKGVIIFLVLGIMTALPALAGFLVANTIWIYLPAIFLILIIAGEFRQIFIRIWYRGSKPVEITASEKSLFRPITTEDLRVIRYEIKRPEIQKSKLRIGFICDLHVNKKLPKEYYISAMDKVSSYDPDILLIGGDFVSVPNDLPWVEEVLSHAKARLGVFAILGNHDYWTVPEQIAAVVEKSGIVNLAGRCITIETENVPRGINLCGCEAPWGKKLYFNNFEKDDPLTFVMTHTPDNIYRLKGRGIASVFAGHYHSGQLRAPFLGSLVVPSKYGRRFDHGHFLLEKTGLFVSSGVGVSTINFRLFCKPDILIVDFLPEASKGE